MFRQTQIFECSKFKEVKIESPNRSILLLDLDNTLINPGIELGSDEWFEGLFEHVKQLDPPVENSKELILDIYHSVQKIMKQKVIETQAPKLIEFHKNRDIPVIAITARGYELANATFRQLNEVGIQFSSPDSLGLPEELPIDLLENNGEAPFFRQGIIFCSGNDKGKCLLSLLQQVTKQSTDITYVMDREGKCQSQQASESKKLIDHVYMVDDKLKHLNSVEKVLHPLNISFTGFRYGALDEKAKEVINHHMMEAHIQLNFFRHHSSLSHVIKPKHTEQLGMVYPGPITEQVARGEFFDLGEQQEASNLNQP